MGYQQRRKKSAKCPVTPKRASFMVNFAVKLTDTKNCLRPNKKNKKISIVGIGYSSTLTETKIFAYKDMRFPPPTAETLSKENRNSKNWCPFLLPDKAIPMKFLFRISKEWWVCRISVTYLVISCFGLDPLEQIVLDSRSRSGEFRVRKLEHRTSSTSGWYR